MQFARIVFMQGEEAIEALDLWNYDEEKALDYLCQWDNGIDSEEVFDYPSAGQSDYWKDVGNYRITWNNRIGYIGLERILN